MICLPIAYSVDIPVSPAILIAGIVAIAIPGVIGALKGLLDIIGFFKARPPHHEVYASKVEVGALEDRLVSLIDEANTASNEAEKRLGARASEIENRIEKQLSRVESTLTSVNHELRSLGTGIAELRGEVHAARSTP
jgi:hypothetical protein